MSKMTFNFWGICKGCGKLVGDATELRDFPTWAKSRSIDSSKPYGPRPVDEQIEKDYQHHPEYVLQKDADVMFKEEDTWDKFSG